MRLKKVGVALILCLLTTSGCALTPGEIQAGTTLGLSSMLTMATIAEKDPVVKKRIVEDCRTIALANNELVKAFFPGATSQQLLSHAVDTSLALLKSKLASSPNGTMIVDLIQAAKVPFAAALGSTASPTEVMSPATRADALAFHTGVSIAIANYCNDPSLMPPIPPPLSTTGEPSPPVTPPVPVPPK